VTGAHTPTRHVSPRWVVRDVVLVLVACAALGALGGVVWEWWWTPPSGVVRDHVWVVDFYESRGLFSATALYVVVGLLGGILVGVTSAYFVDRVELVTLGAVVAGSVIGAWLMVVVGTALAPPDPAVVARTSPDETVLPDTLEVSGHWALGAFPAGAMLGVAVVYIGLTSTRRSRG
jgi:hypothetical protein